jgi:hypothetical protein
MPSRQQNTYYIQLLDLDFELKGTRALVVLRKAIRLAIKSGDFPLQTPVIVTVKSGTYVYTYQVIRPYDNKKRTSFIETELSRLSHKRHAASQKLRSKKKLPNVVSSTDFNDNATDMALDADRPASDSKSSKSNTSTADDTSLTDFSHITNLKKSAKSAKKPVKPAKMLKKARQAEIEAKRKAKMISKKESALEPTEPTPDPQKKSKKSKKNKQSSIHPSAISADYALYPSNIDECEDAADIDTSDSE